MNTLSNPYLELIVLGLENFGYFILKGYFTCMLIVLSILFFVVAKFFFKSGRSKISSVFCHIGYSVGLAACISGFIYIINILDDLLQR